MTLKHLIYSAIALSTMLGPVSAQAQFRHRGPGPGFGGGPRPLPPDNPLPAPGGPGYPPGNGGNYPPGPGNGYPQPGQPCDERKTLNIFRRVMNERFPLLAMAGIDRRYDGYIVDSVEVAVRGSDIRTQIGLFINGRVDTWANSPQGYVRLVPRFQAVLGQAVRGLDLDVRGMSDIDSITINLRRGNNGGYPQPGPGPNPGPAPIPAPGGPGQDRIVVPLNVARRMLGNDVLDLTPYINMNQFRGYRIEAIEFEAASLMNVSFIDVAINNMFQIPRVQVGPWIQKYTVNPQNAVLGQNTYSVMFYTYGNLDIRCVTLILSACGNGGNYPQPPGGNYPPPPPPPGGNYPPQPPRPR